MKTIYLALISLGAAMLVAGCGGGSSGAASSATTASGKVTLTSANAPAVADGAMSTSQTAAKQGSTGAAAAATGVVVQTGAPRQSVMNIALAQIRRVEGLKLPVAPASVVGVLPTIPPIDCSGGGTMTILLTDTNNNNAFDATDVIDATFASCIEPDAAGTVTTNGVMSITFYSKTSTDMSVAVSFSNFSSATTSPAETITLSGSMTMAINDTGTTLTATISGTTFAMASSVDGSFTMKNYSIGFTGDSPDAVSPTYNYSFTVTMTTNIAALGGDVDITTPTPFTGTGDSNPTAGVMVITGDNGGTLTLTAQPDGTAVTVVLDTDGASGSTAPQTLASTTWDAI